jgi:anti-anti-sigma factor
VINIRQVGITVELGIRGEVDMASVATLREQLSRALANKPEILIVDLRAVTFIDSSGLHALLSARSRAVATGTALVVIRPTGPADRVFTLTGLDTIFPDVEAAMHPPGQEPMHTGTDWPP